MSSFMGGFIVSEGGGDAMNIKDPRHHSIYKYCMVIPRLATSL